MRLQFGAAALTVWRREFNNRCNAVAFRRDAPLMKFRTPVNLVLADCPVSYSKHNSTASELQQLGLATPSKATTAIQVLTSLFFQPLTRPDASGTLQQPHRPIIRANLMRIHLWTQVLRCV
jgi:hypothetical protein